MLWGVAFLAALAGAFLVQAEPQKRGQPQGNSANTEVRKTQDEKKPQYERRNAIVEAVEKTRESIVTLKMTRRGQWGVKDVNGCGVIIDSRGYAVTSQHVVAGCEKISVLLSDDTECPASIVVQDTKTDLAIVRFRTDKKIRELALAPGGDLMVGETVIAVGHPFGYKNTVSTGIVSATEREIVMPNSGEKLKNLIQITAAINPGNSGGALLNINGELIGINTAVRNDAQGIAFAINADTVKDVLAQHLSADKVSKVDHGLKCHEELTTEPQRCKVVVDEVSERSPARAAGLRPGDVVLRLGAQPVCNRFDLERAFWGYAEGESIEAVVIRDGKENRLSLTLGREGEKRVTLSRP
jgi:serine protease Do